MAIFNWLALLIPLGTLVALFLLALDYAPARQTIGDLDGLLRVKRGWALPLRSRRGRGAFQFGSRPLVDDRMGRDTAIRSVPSIRSTRARPIDARICTSPRANQDVLATLVASKRRRHREAAPSDWFVCSDSSGR